MGRALTPQEQNACSRRRPATRSGTTSTARLSGREHIDARRRGKARTTPDVDLEKVWDIESATGKGVLYVSHSKNETSKRRIPLNEERARRLSECETGRRTRPHGPTHYLWCASQHHKLDRRSPRRNGTPPGARCGRPLAGWLPVPYLRTRSSRICSSRRARARHRSGHRAPLATDVEHYSHQRLKATGPDAHADGGAAEKGER